LNFSPSEIFNVAVGKEVVRASSMAFYVYEPTKLVCADPTSTSANTVKVKVLTGLSDGNFPYYHGGGGIAEHWGHHASASAVGKGVIPGIGDSGWVAGAGRATA
jgi:hypothetical protein